MCHDAERIIVKHGLKEHGGLLPEIELSAFLKYI